MRRLIREVAQDERDEGSGWLEIQVDPSGYASRFGGLTPTVELVLDAAAAAAAATGVGIGVIIAANRTRHPLDARTLARLAVAYAGRGVVGFGLSNDERRGAAADFAPAFRIASRAGLMAVPHGGELAGPASVRACIDDLHADRIGHGVAAAEGQAPDATHRLGRHHARGVPVVQRGARGRRHRGRRAAAGPAGCRGPGGAGRGRPAAVRPRGSPRSTRSRGTTHGLSDGELAELARMSVRGSAAPAEVRARHLAGIDDWLASPAAGGPRAGQAASPRPAAD